MLDRANDDASIDGRLQSSARMNQFGDGQALSCAEVDAQLVERYTRVLDFDSLVKLGRDETAGKLSGLFLPAATEEYLQSDIRIMLVGKEPRKWGKALQDLVSIKRTPAALGDYVRAQMECHRRTMQINPGRSKFLQFHRRLAATLGPAAHSRAQVAWGNLLCASLNEGSPCRGVTQERIAELSRLLLAAQIEVLAPELIVFASGYGYDRFVKALFDHTWETQPGFIKRSYWPFKSAGMTAYRVAHPQSHTRAQTRTVLDAVRIEINSRRAVSRGTPCVCGSSSCNQHLTEPRSRL
jgi:hypothetical protein